MKIFFKIFFLLFMIHSFGEGLLSTYSFCDAAKREDAGTVFINRSNKRINGIEVAPIFNGDDRKITFDMDPEDEVTITCDNIFRRSLTSRSTTSYEWSFTLPRYNLWVSFGTVLFVFNDHKRIVNQGFSFGWGALREEDHNLECELNNNQIDLYFVKIIFSGENLEYSSIELERRILCIDEN